MEPAASLHLSWRDPDAYAGLIEAERSLFAWEWLRRDPAYRSAAQMLASTADPALGARFARQFGLVRFEPVDVPVPYARPIWRAEAYPYVLMAEAGRRSATESAFELQQVWHHADLVRGRLTDHLLLTDGVRAIRLDGPSGAFTRKPLCLRFPMERLVAGELPLLHLRRLVALLRSGSFVPSLHPPEPRARRWILQLRTHDAIAAGAGLREIAEELLGRSSAGPGWRARDPSLRSQAQRLVRSARALANGGFREFLRPPSRSTASVASHIAMHPVEWLPLRNAKILSLEALRGIAQLPD